MFRIKVFIRHSCALGLVLYGSACLSFVMAETAPVSTTVIRNKGEGSNRIVVMDNSAQHVTADCSKSAQGAEVGVNSVIVDGKSLKGETIIVTGRNTRNARVDTGCDQKAGSNGGSANGNSVMIR